MAAALEVQMSVCMYVCDTCYNCTTILKFLDWKTSAGLLQDFWRTSEGLLKDFWRTYKSQPPGLRDLFDLTCGLIVILQLPVIVCFCIVVSMNQPFLCRQYPNELNIIPASVVIRINHLHLLTNYTTPHIYHSLLSCLHSSFCIASVRDNWNILNRSITPVMRPSIILD